MKTILEEMQNRYIVGGLLGLSLILLTVIALLLLFPKRVTYVGGVISVSPDQKTLTIHTSDARNLIVFISAETRFVNRDGADTWEAPHFSVPDEVVIEGQHSEISRSIRAFRIWNLATLQLPSPDFLPLSEIPNSIPPSLKLEESRRRVPVSLSTSEWATYTDPELGISLKHPPLWKFSLSKVTSTSEESRDGRRQGTSFVTGEELEAPLFRFDIAVNSHDYNNYLSSYPSLSNVSVNPNWSREQFAREMNTPEENIFFVKKLSSRSLLIALYSNLECSPTIDLRVLTPLMPDYPNVSISVLENFEDDPEVFAHAQSQEEKGEDACDAKEPFAQIARSIEQDTYSPSLAENIAIAQAIADSVQRTR